MTPTHDPRDARHTTRSTAWSGDETPGLDGWERAALWAPPLLAALAAATVLTGAGRWVESATAVVAYGASVVAFVVLVADADRRRAAGAAPRPPLVWQVAGATVVVAGLLLAAGFVPVAPPDAVGYYAGLALVSVFLSPVVLGPLSLARDRSERR